MTRKEPYPRLHAVIRLLDRFNEAIGHALGWAALALVLVQFILVLSTAVFAQGSIWLQESRLYINALIFLGGAGYALLHEDHVRVDLFYRTADPVARSWVDFLGSFIFLMPFLFLIWWAGLPYVFESIISNEGSLETGGLPFVYLKKALILMFAATLSLQSIALILRAGLRLFDDNEAAI